MSDMTDYQKFIHLSRYARWLDTENRRETWEETVNRYLGIFNEVFKFLHTQPGVESSSLPLIA